MFILYLCQIVSYIFSLRKFKMCKTENITSKTNIIDTCHLIIGAIVWFNIGIIIFIFIMLYKSREV